MSKNSKKRPCTMRNNIPRYVICNEFVPYEYEDDYQFYNDPVPPYDNFYQDSEVDLLQDLSKDQSRRVNLTPATSNEIRIINKQNLYEDWSLFYTINETNRINHNTLSCGMETNAWTDSFWKKNIHSDHVVTSLSHSKIFKREEKTENALEKSLQKMLAKPAEMSKGKSLLEKMGWTGGGLGRDGPGIEEPIAPKATYAVNTIGLGHPTESQLKKSKNVYAIPIEDPEYKANFRTNVLLYVLEFVKNDAEVELIFDHRFWREERKCVHRIIECLREFDDYEEFEEDNYEERDLDIVKEIWEHNMFNLWTESVGKKADRKLYLYKEAREHVYLVTPADLRELADEKNSKNEVIAQVKKNKVKNKKSGKTNKKLTALEIKFANELKLDKEEMERTNVNTEEINSTETILGSIVKYFKEFSESCEYTEFRYLGPFNDEEVTDWRLFYDICTKRDETESLEKTDLLRTLNNALYIFEVLEDCNGSTVIYKFGRRLQLAPQVCWF